MKPGRRILAAAVLLVGGLLPGEAIMQASPAGTTLVVPVAGVHGVAADASAVAVNLTATNAAAPGYLRAYPCGDTAPATSSVNYFDAAPVANFAVVGVGEGGAICIFTLAESDVIVDVQGWFRGAGYSSLASPRRLLDTRQSSGPVGPRSVTRVPVAGQRGVAGNAAAVAVNLTVTEPAANGYVTAYPCGEATPETSSVNFLAGQTVANFAVVGVGEGSSICLFSLVQTEVIVDVQGWFGDDGLASLERPERLLDTRLGAGEVAPRSVTRVPVAGQRGVDGDATSVAVNLTVTEPAANGYVTAYPCGDDLPGTSSLNFRAGETVANFAVVGVGEEGSICLYSLGSTQVIVDVQGAVDSDAYTALAAPVRVLDTRPPEAPAPAPPGPTPPGDDPDVPLSLGAGDVMFTFDDGVALEGLRQGVYHRNAGSQELGQPAKVWGDTNAWHGGSWTADHDLSCGPPDTQRELSSTLTPNHATQQVSVDFNVEQLQFACRNHWMTSMGDVDGYSIVWFAPDAQFTRAEQRTVSWDVGVTDLLGRKWWEVSIVPVGSPFLATVDWMAEVAEIAAYDSASVIVGSGPAGRDPNITTEGLQRYTGGQSVCALDPEGCASKPIRRQFSVTDNGNGTITVDYGGMFTQTVPGQFPERFEVYFKDHSYTPDKDGRPVGYTLHWDNIVVR
ncbi:MAG TPA: hypothetical protein VNQ73_05565 [Ilumatobacter sp.]|nr:hypothetical protein [Ilumatobacter sp.]